MTNRLYFGDNLDILREHIADASVDLIYLDPPFNSKRDYNLLFKTPKGHESDAQITAFEDSWHWGEQAEREFNEILRQPNTDVAELMPALRSFLGENDMMAYLVMMANRLLELHRVLKPSGSIYLHCDPTASHYLKIVLDGVFGKEKFRNEIAWRRTRGHNDLKLSKFGANHDILLYYTKSDERTFNRIFSERDENAPKTHDLYQHTDGLLYRKDNCRAPGDRGPRYEWNGHIQNWRFTQDEARRLESEGKIVFSNTGMPRVLRPVDLTKGHPLQDTWTDIDIPNSGSGELLGYPTQKPLALLERIILASSNEGDVVLDPFCGCGTAVHAAQKLGRRWIGIDITHLAVSLIEKRLKDAFPYLNRKSSETVSDDERKVADAAPDYLQTFEVIGTPEDLDGARNLAERDKYQFQWWACSLVNAQPYQGKKKGADGGIDGLIFFQDDKGAAKKIVVSVKGGDNVNVAMVRDLAHVVAREKAEIGLFVTLAEPSKPMTTEAIKEGFYTSPAINAEFPRIQILTIAGLLDGSERARYPDLAQGGHTFKKAKVDLGKKDQGKLF
ncbi:MAG TPA: DNA methyltransferase [Rudaea sp.]|jgi:DNA modification methylase|uniref:DNA methyltransferase n=1 Tax=Rudaea sp. TaxID=2136325 RepID=UPI002F950BE2